MPDPDSLRGVSGADPPSLALTSATPRGGSPARMSSSPKTQENHDKDASINRLSIAASTFTPFSDETIEKLSTPPRDDGRSHQSQVRSLPHNGTQDGDLELQDTTSDFPPRSSSLGIRPLPYSKPAMSNEVRTIIEDTYETQQLINGGALRTPAPLRDDSASRSQSSLLTPVPQKTLRKTKSWMSNTSAASIRSFSSVSTRTVESVKSFFSRKKPMHEEEEEEKEKADISRDVNEEDIQKVRVMTSLMRRFGKQ